MNVAVLAIDREGTGDVHAVYIPYQGTDIENALETVVANIQFSPPQAKILPHFIYTAIVNNGPGASKCDLSEQIIQKSFALVEDGVGRVGILYVDLTEDEPSVKVILKAERFRSSKELVEMADQFVASHTTANWELRE